MTADMQREKARRRRLRSVRAPRERREPKTVRMTSGGAFKIGVFIALGFFVVSLMLGVIWGALIVLAG